MLTKSVSMDLFLGQLMTIAKTAIFKRNERADACETTQTIKDAEKYITAIEMGDDWNTYVTFHYSVLAAAGFNKDLISEIMENGKNSIPYDMRDLVCRLEKEFIISSYEEKNDYYRMLNGEPSVADMESGNFVYMPPNDYGIPTNVPIHELAPGYIEYYNSSGLREKVYAANPGKEYLLHQGVYKISYYKARTARNYDLLYIQRAENDSVTMEFLRQYSAARDYIMMGLYTKEDQKMYENYDSFMGFMIMAVTIQRTISCVYEQGITRDFFDNDFIRHLFDAYNIPYIETIDIPYQKLIAKRLNILLQKKSSDAVLFDITSLFDYNAVDIYRYYLVKDYKKDENGDPIIIYRKVVDEDGNIHEVVDFEKTFDVYFQKVNIKSKDPAFEIADQSNRVPYNSITGEDPYWLNDSDLINKIYNNDFNSILTKYLCIDISYELAKMMYESTHLVRMIIDDQADYKEIKINLPYASEPVSLFDTILFLCALSAKKIGMAGSVPLKGYQIAQVYGFNFKEDIDLLREKIIQDVESCTGFYKKVKLDILNYLNTLNATTLDGARKMFENIEELRIWLDTAMRYCNDIEEYRAYRKLYQSTLIVEDVQELYTKTDGTYASTFAELLADRRPDLKDVLDLTDAGVTEAYDDETSDETETNFSINNKINRVLLELSKLSEQLKDIKYSNDKSAIVANIEKVINQFKSYTVDQTASSVLYLIRDPHITMLKMIDRIIVASRDKLMKDKLTILYGDILHQIIIYSKQKEKLKWEEWYWDEKLALYEDFIHIIDEINLSDAIKLLEDMPIHFNDFIHEVYGIDYDSEDWFVLDEEGLFRVKEVIKEYIHLHPHEIIYQYSEYLKRHEMITNDSIHMERDFLILGTLFMMHKVINETTKIFDDHFKFDHEIYQDYSSFLVRGMLYLYDHILSFIMKDVGHKLNLSKYKLIPERYSIMRSLLNIDDDVKFESSFDLERLINVTDAVKKDLVIKQESSPLTVKEKIFMERDIAFRELIKLTEKIDSKKIVDYKEILAYMDEIRSLRRSRFYKTLNLKDGGIHILSRPYNDTYHLDGRMGVYTSDIINNELPFIDSVSNEQNLSINQIFYVKDNCHTMATKYRNEEFYLRNVMWYTIDTSVDDKLKLDITVEKYESMSINKFLNIRIEKIGSIKEVQNERFKFIDRLKYVDDEIIKNDCTIIIDDIGKSISMSIVNNITLTHYDLAKIFGKNYEKKKFIHVYNYTMNKMSKDQTKLDITAEKYEYFDIDHYIKMNDTDLGSIINEFDEKKKFIHEYNHTMLKTNDDFTNINTTVEKEENWNIDKPLNIIHYDLGLMFDDYNEKFKLNDKSSFFTSMGLNSQTSIFDHFNKDSVIVIRDSTRIKGSSPEQPSNRKLNNSDYYVKNATMRLNNSVGFKETIRKIYEEV